jgi:hypothetical protein
MFLLNHWVSSDAAGRDEAADLNNADVVVERARHCAVERGARVTMVAVNFADIGDVVGAVAQLNREAPLQGCAAHVGDCPPVRQLAAPAVIAPPTVRQAAPGDRVPARP